MLTFSDLTNGPLGSDVAERVLAMVFQARGDHIW